MAPARYAICLLLLMLRFFITPLIHIVYITDDYAAAFTPDAAAADVSFHCH